MRDLLTPREFAQLCGVSPDTVRSWCFRKQINYATTTGGHRRFRKQDVLEFLKARGFPLPQTDKLSPIRVLVVDDDESFRSGLVDTLQKEINLNVKEAANGYEAGRMIGEFEPDVLILDLVMPGIDGFKVCRDIKSSDKTGQVRIIVVTGFPDKDMLQRAREAGADICLAKPVEVEKLIEKILGKYRGSTKRKTIS